MRLWIHACRCTDVYERTQTEPWTFTRGTDIYELVQADLHSLTDAFLE